MITILKQTEPIAKKEHKCMFCGSSINVGTKYDKQTIVFENVIYDWAVHKECSEIARRLEMYDDCDDGVSGDDFCRIIDEYILSEHYDHNIDDLAEEWQPIYLSKDYFTKVKAILNELNK